jgi:NADH-quinone oxidoreductase subunit J
VLLAVTALGAVGVLLMLPRERKTWVRIGALVGLLALAGLFLFLVGQAPRTNQDTPPIYFYLFAGIMIAGSVGVISHPRPVYAALYFVLVTLAGAGLFVLLLAQFMAIVLIIVYAGAILVTYVFVLMLASQGGGKTVLSEPAEYDRIASGPFPAVLVSFVLLGTVLLVMNPRNGAAITVRNPAHDDPRLIASVTGIATSDASAATTTLPAAPPFVPGNIQVLGAALYGNYAFSLELAGLLLTIALVGAVIIARKNQEYEAQVGTGELPVE